MSLGSLLNGNLHFCSTKFLFFIAIIYEWTFYVGHSARISQELDGRHALLVDLDSLLVKLVSRFCGQNEGLLD